MTMNSLQPEKAPVLPQGVYTIQKLQEKITWIYDGINDSIYVVEGNGEAFVIDTGMADAPLLPVIRKITDLPLTLVVTHGHGDHVARAAEFGPFYMSAKDDHFLEKRPDIDLKNRIDILDGDVIRIPGVELIAVDSHGHTPGSFSFIDAAHKVVFTGDAFGSGNNVWMQLPGCSMLSDYRDTVRSAAASMKKAGVDETYTFCGGHYEQKFQFREDGLANEPGLTLLDDMAVLCDRILDGTIRGTEGGVSRGDTAYTARFGKAEMLYTLKQIG